MSQGMKTDPTKIRPYIGDMNIAIKWMPCTDPNKPEVGQIGLHLVSIRFEAARVEDPSRKNPFVEVVTYREDGTAINIPRWDPRTALRKVGNKLTAGVAYQGAFTDHMQWMKLSLVNVEK